MCFFPPDKNHWKSDKGFFSVCWTQADTLELLLLGHLNVSSLHWSSLLGLLQAYINI